MGRIVVGPFRDRCLPAEDFAHAFSFNSYNSQEEVLVRSFVTVDAEVTSPKVTELFQGILSGGLWSLRLGLCS